MRSSKKALWVLGCILATAGLTYVVIKKAKKAEKDIDDQETKDRQDLAELGVSPESLGGSELNLTSDLVRGAHHMVYRSRDWEDEVINEIINPDVVLEKASVLHLVETEFRGKRHLDFIFELPNYTEEAYKFPKIGDFKSAFNNAAEEMWARKVVKSNRPYTRLEGYMAVNVKDRDNVKERSYVRRIPCEWYKNYAREADDGVARFYEDYNDPKKHEEMKQVLLKNFLDNYVKGPIEEGTELQVVEVFLGWRISFMIQGNNRGQGINLISTMKCIKYLVDDFEVRRSGGNKVIKYDHILFHEADGTSDIPANFIGLNGQMETYTY